MYIFSNEVKASIDGCTLGVFSSHNAAYRAFCNLLPDGAHFDLSVEDRKEFDKMRKNIDCYYFGNIHC